MLEESNWQNDKLNGIYRSYFQDGKTLLECNYLAGQRNGTFKTWFPNGQVEIDAYYSGDSRDKDWKYYNESGELQYTLKYELGKLLNPEVQDRIEKAKAGTYKSKGDSVPDPEKFIQNPEEYMRLMQIN